MRRFGITMVLALLLPVSVASVQATVVSGRVTNGGGDGIPDVDLDFIDRDTGQSIPLVNDNTDFLGFYAVTVPEGDYDVRFEPLPGVRYVGLEEPGFRAEGASATLDATLDSGWFLDGRVIDEGSAPVGLLDLDFVDSVDGPIFVANDRTDAAGNFNVVVPAATYAIELEPTAASGLVPQRIDAIVVGADTSIGDVTLLQGVHLSGLVVDPTGVPAPTPVNAVQVLTLDPADGSEIFNIRNHTDDLGAYDLVVAPGELNLQFIPPRGTKFLTRLIGGVELQSDTVLPQVPLDEGSLASGTVLDPAAGPAAGTDLDFYEASSGIQAFTPKDNADDAGEYAVAVPPGTYQVGFTPPAATGLAPAQLESMNLANSDNLPTVQLQVGRTVSGVVRNGAAQPLVGVDLDFIDPASGTELLTGQDKSDAAGAFAVIVPAGTFDIEFSPPDGSGVGQLTLPATVVSGDLDLGPVTLPDASAPVVVGLAPSSGSALGGTLVSVSGGNFAPGVKISLGGITLSGVTHLDAATVQGTTRLHPVGTVDVVVTNPGAEPIVLPTAFTYTTPAVEPVLTLQRTGPIGTDLLLQWSDTGRAVYSVYRSTSATGFRSIGTPHAPVLGTSYRDDGAAAASAGSTLFYLVY